MADFPPALVDSLRNRYVIERELGHGGMATVYLARDLRHSRPIALKVLRPELAHALGPERFLREIRIAAGLQHPNILPVHDSGVAPDRQGGPEIFWFAMPYVEGESLRQRLDREAELPVDEALRIALAVASGLGHAHSHGIVHRDVKPENILLSADHCVIADFGVARALDAAGERLTETGLALGTPAYMSPEQAAADGTLDGRSDIYSLGCVLYEMLAGEPPFTGRTAQAVIARRMADPVPRLRTVRDVPESLEQVVTRALARSPADRFPSASAFADALRVAVRSPGAVRASAGRRRIAMAVAAVTALGAFGMGVREWRSGSAGDGESIHSLAVAPFENLTGDSTQQYLARGITDQLITELAQVGALRVIDLKSGRQQLPASELARTLQTEALLTGSIQRVGDALHINARLTSTRAGQFLWAAGFDGELSQVLNLQRAVARSVIERLRIHPTVRERTRIDGLHRPVDPPSFEAYVRGAYFLSKMSVPGFRRAAGHFQEAIEADPAYAPAYAGLANCYINLGYYGAEAPREIRLKSRAAAMKAVELDSTLPAGFVALARHELYYTWDLAAAERNVRHALELDPRHAEAHWVYGMLLAGMNRRSQSIAEVERAQELDPLSLIIQSASSRAYYNARRYGDALAQARSALEIDSTHSRAHFWVAMASEQLLRSADAIRAFETTIAYAGPSSVYVGALGHAYAVAGQRRKALTVLGQLGDEAKRRYVSPLDIATVYVGLNDREATFAWLERAYQVRSTALVYLAVDPRFDPVRDDPRFNGILRRIGLPTDVRPDSSGS